MYMHLSGCFEFFQVADFANPLKLFIEKTYNRNISVVLWFSELAVLIWTYPSIKDIKPNS